MQMKLVQIRRHAPKAATGELTPQGKDEAEQLKNKLKPFHLVISSDKPRAQETAFLLTGVKPLVDTRAGTPPFTPEQEEELHKLGQTHTFGIAGVIFENPLYRQMIKQKGESLAELIKETINKLPENGSALIISHDGVMVAAYKVLSNGSFEAAEKTIKPLAGYEVNENLSLTDIDPDAIHSTP